MYCINCNRLAQFYKPCLDHLSHLIQCDLSKIQMSNPIHVSIVNCVSVMKSHQACYILCYHAVIASRVTEKIEIQIMQNYPVVFAQAGAPPIHTLLPIMPPPVITPTSSVRRQSEAISQAVQIIETMKASVHFMLLGRQVTINTRAVMEVLFFKLLEFYQIVQADLLSQIG